jgi:hypothetical protein
VVASGLVGPTGFLIGSDLATRADSLRSYGKLPRGRENRARRLSTSEITAAILGLVPVNPNWAGHAAVILGDLRPVGGTAASFRGAATLTSAVESLLTDRSARENLVSLTLSLAERFTNCNGSATLLYTDGEIRLRTAFVSKMAVSLLQPGAERSFEIDGLHATVSRCAVFTRAFFDLVETAIMRSLASPRPPTGDGSEYNAEEVLQARYKVLTHWRLGNEASDSRMRTCKRCGSADNARTR